MDRFVALISDASSDEEEVQVRCWLDDLSALKGWMAIDRPGFRLLCKAYRDGVSAVRLHDGEGAILGSLFRRGAEQSGPVASFGPVDSGLLRISEGGNLIANYWGAYLAFWRDPATGAVSVLRDPCGAPPCFMARVNGIDLICSDVADIACLEGVHLSIDWEYVKAFLLYSYFITRHTGLREVKELLAGERVTYKRQSEPVRSWTWNAAEIAATPLRGTFAEATSNFREITEDCFSAWGRAYPRILVQLSGGIDSSILVNLLRRTSDAEIHALHFVGADYEAYEGRLARMAAQHADVPLIEERLHPERAELRSIVDEPPLARPTQQVFGQHTDSAIQRACQEAGADVLMAGHGGDGLFLQRVLTERVLEDHVRLNGVGRGLWQTAYDTACVQERSIYNLLAETLGNVVRGKPWRPFDFLDARVASGQCLLKTEAIASVDQSYRVHPWFSDATKLPPCKASQVRALIALYGYHAQRGKTAVGETLSPWFSQPIAEFALRTPAWIFSEGGIDRALERSAFGDIVPEAIARRTGKGLIDHQLLLMAHRNLDFLRGLILEGELIRRDWFDRDKVERMLSPEHILSGAGMSSLYALVATEAWLATWRANHV